MKECTCVAAFVDEVARLRTLAGIDSREETTRGVGAALQRYLDDLAVPVLVSDDRSRYVAVNDAAMELTGYSRSELLRNAVPDLTFEGELSTTEGLWNAFVRDGMQMGAYVLRRRDGSALPVEYEAYANFVPGLHVSFLLRRP